jgi:putative flavoprotein involved in K+ transport
MNERSSDLDVAVIGAGWAGVSVSYALMQAGLHHAVFERYRVCETWRTQRWASFRMNTPNIMTVLPGDRYHGDEPEGYMTRDEFVTMVEGYARQHRLPIRENTGVVAVRPLGDRFSVQTASAEVIARAVVVATGNLNIPLRPRLASKLPETVNQIDGSEYRDAVSLPEGAILVVGCGNSGGQIAEDLVYSGRRVYLSTGRNGRVPRTYRNRDIFLWLTDTGRMARPRKTSAGRGLIGATHTISLQSLSAMGVALLGRLDGVKKNGRLTFLDTLADSAAFGDAMSEELRHEIDAYIHSTGITAPTPLPDPAETVAPRFPSPPIRELDLLAENVTTVIWSTGFTGDFSWLQVPGATDEKGHPIQENCVSMPGVYFAGLDSSKSLKAGTVLVATEEAEAIVNHIAARRGSA